MTSLAHVSDEEQMVGADPVLVLQEEKSLLICLLHDKSRHAHRESLVQQNRVPIHIEDETLFSERQEIVVEKVVSCV